MSSKYLHVRPLTTLLRWCIITILVTALPAAMLISDLNLRAKQNRDLQFVYDSSSTVTLNYKLNDNDTHTLDLSIDHQKDVQKALARELVGALEIPVVSIVTPIYNNVKERTLNEGVGIVGGTGDLEHTESHNVLIAGHNGLSIKHLFTQLPHVHKHDKFFITMPSKKTREFEITHIAEPDANKFNENVISYLPSKRGESRVTLMTCTPIYQNTHRFVVRGKQIKYNPNDRFSNSNSRLPFWTTWRALLTVAVFGLMLAITAYRYLSQVSKEV